MPRFVSFFRAINLGAKSTVKMADLRQMHEELGFADVASILQTGNVIFEAEGSPAKLEKQIAEAFEKRFGFVSEVMVRTADEMNDIAKRCPFAGDSDRAPNWIVVVLLEQAVPKAQQESLLSSYHGPEEIVFSGKEMFIYYPEGIGRSKLTAAVTDRHTKVKGTSRNWNTVSKILEKI